MDVNKFWCLVTALPHVWTDKTHWCRDRRDKPWAVFTPSVVTWNDKQVARFEELNLSASDESMVDWVPKTFKLGGLPDCTLEPRKPKPLGTMSKDTAECVTGIMMHTA